MKKLKQRLRAWAYGLLVAAALAACGGGGSGPSSSTPIPENLAIMGPSTAESATAVAFGTSIGSVAGLRYQWDFGDGSISNEAAPSHSFANGGDFEVVLKVTNEAGMSRETCTTVSITNLANVRGLECSGAASTGWCWQYGRFVPSIFFLNSSLGWRGGEGGEIFRTSDGGVTWIRQESGVRESIQAIHFFDASTGWALGIDRSVLRTTDGGVHWTLTQTIGIPGTQVQPTEGWGDLFTNLSAVDARTVFVRYRPYISFGLELLYGSQDGGVTWREIEESDSGVPRYFPQITSASRFWRITDNVVSVSNDFGQTYSPVLSPTPPPEGYRFYSAVLFARDDLHASLITSDSRVDPITSRNTFIRTAYTTVDGGVNWSKVVTPLFPASISANGKILTALDLNTAWISVDGGLTWEAKPSMPRSNTYQSLGGSTLAACTTAPDFREPTQLWLSEDDGQTWTELSLPRSCDGLRRIDANTLVSSGDWQRPFQISRDKGRTWTDVIKKEACATSLKSVAFMDAKNGFMYADACGYFSTKDGGASWDVWKPPFPDVQSLQFLNKSNGWLVADGRLYKSTDAGQTWANVAMGAVGYFARAVFESETLGWARLASGDTVWTRDGGKTWAAMPPSLRAWYMRLGTQSWAALGEGGRIYVSTDSGGTWTMANTTGNASSLYAIAFSDAKTAWAVGRQNTLLKSEDAGLNWTRIELPALSPEGEVDLNDISFVNAQVGWIVGTSGHVLATRDGGKTWRKQVSGTGRGLTTILAVDANTAWIVTDSSGLVSESSGLLATGTGGN